MNKLSYLQDFWNVFDLLRSAITVTYCGLRIYEHLQGEDNFLRLYDYLLAIINFLTWFRAISYLRLFKQTRSLIRLIIEVIKDMKAFAIVLFLSIICFTMTYYSLQGSQDFNGSSSHIFLLMHGDFSYDDYTPA